MSSDLVCCPRERTTPGDRSRSACGSRAPRGWSTRTFERSSPRPADRRRSGRCCCWCGPSNWGTQSGRPGRRDHRRDADPPSQLHSRVAGWCGAARDEQPPRSARRTDRAGLELFDRLREVARTPRSPVALDAPPPDEARAGRAVGPPRRRRSAPAVDRARAQAAVTPLPRAEDGRDESSEVGRQVSSGISTRPRRISPRSIADLGCAQLGAKAVTVAAGDCGAGRRLRRRRAVRAIATPSSSMHFRRVAVAGGSRRLIPPPGRSHSRGP